jgi:hypothetical protein
MQELGRGLVVEPYFATVLGAKLLRSAAAQATCSSRSRGELKLACALGERQSRHDLRDDRGARAPTATAGCWTAKRRWCCTAPRPACCWSSARSAASAIGRHRLFAPPTHRASRVTDYRTSTASAPPTSRSPTCASAPTLLGRPAGTSSTPRSTTAPACCAPRRSARWKRCSPPRSTTSRRASSSAPDRQVPGAAAPHGRHVHPPRTGALDGLAGGRAPARRRCERRRSAVSAAKYRVGQARASSASRRCSCTAAWASPTNCRPRIISSA